MFLLINVRWVDFQMRWDPREYEGIRTIRVPPDRVWLPDVVLFNNADGNYEVSYYSNVVVEHTGEMLWVPPAIYKSSCTIDVEFFPFDEQTCSMVFGSWTFNKDEVTLKYLHGKRQVDLNDYSASGIWDIMQVPGRLISKKSKIAYEIHIRRKPLFYTVILIVPTVLMAFLSMLVFYLPAEADEKITLAISILLALVVFLLLVSKILPPTSSTIPLLAKYLLMTFIMNLITILVTVVIINIYFRGPTTHTMSPMVRTVFLKYLAMFLMMHRPHRYEWQKVKKRKRRLESTPEGSERENGQSFKPGEFVEMSQTKVHHPHCSFVQNGNARERVESTVGGTHERLAGVTSHQLFRNELNSMLTDEAIEAIDAVEYISDHLKREKKNKRIRDEWKHVAMVIDRLLLYVFFAVTAGGTIGILFSAPNVFESVDQDAILGQLKKSAEAEVLAWKQVMEP
ncbi:Protein ACR-3 [Aphelenchoides avenae]|nr:Protein ACR-3 [Aphelenchus avenae]